MERLGIRVTDDGYTRIEEQAKAMNVATDWKDLDSYKDLLVSRLTQGPGSTRKPQPAAARAPNAAEPRRAD